MYLETRKTKSGEKHYLAHSFREAGKVHKIRVYLGSNISAEVLEQRRLRATELLHQQLNSFKIVRSPINYKFSKREEATLNLLRDKIKHLKIIHLSEKDWNRFTELFTYNTNAIEGSTITQEEVLNILGENKWPYAKPKEDISETYGVAEAIKYIRKTKQHISLDLMLQIHKIIFNNSKSFAGQFRKKGTEVGIRDGFGNIVHLGAPSSRVVGLLSELVDWYNKNKNNYSAVVLAAVVHNQFEYIHPFEDGNGRVGRLLMNNILIKHHMPPVNITMTGRKEYYESIRLFQNSGDIKPTIDVIIKEYKAIAKDLKVVKKKEEKIEKKKKPAKTPTKKKAKSAIKIKAKPHIKKKKL